MSPSSRNVSKANINVWIAADLRAEVGAKARLEDVTITEVVEQLLTDWVLGQTSLDAYRNPRAIE